jgi:hypothetical protein
MTTARNPLCLREDSKIYSSNGEIEIEGSYNLCIENIGNVVATLEDRIPVPIFGQAGYMRVYPGNSLGDKYTGTITLTFAGAGGRVLVTRTIDA